MASNGYQWWLSRIAWASRLFDGLRLDHFRGFESFWAIPAKAKSAAEGSWLPGPGKAFLDAVKAQFPDVWFLAEDLGSITPQVRRLLSSTGFWGMRVLQFGFENDWTNEHLPHNYQEQIVGYTSLHDTMTAKQWLSSAPKWQRSAARRYLGREKLSGGSDRRRAGLAGGVGGGCHAGLFGAGMGGPDERAGDGGAPKLELADGAGRPQYASGRKNSPSVPRWRKKTGIILRQAA